MIEISNLSLVLLIVFSFILGSITWEYIKSQLK